MTQPSHEPHDLYALPADKIQQPPHTVLGALKQIGPGLILAASIVGTGELINTTGLGAKAGFTLLWLILLSCVIKVFVQVELGRYAITHGKTTLAAFDTLPGPEAGGVVDLLALADHDAGDPGPDRRDGRDRRPGRAHGVPRRLGRRWPSAAGAVVPAWGTFLDTREEYIWAEPDDARGDRAACSRAAIDGSRGSRRCWSRR